MHALLKALAFELPTTGAPALAILLETARKPTFRLWAEQLPFELKDSLKKRRYHWNDGSDGRPKFWYVDVCKSVIKDETANAFILPIGIGPFAAIGVSPRGGHRTNPAGSIDDSRLAGIAAMNAVGTGQTTATKLPPDRPTSITCWAR